MSTNENKVFVVSAENPEGTYVELTHEQIVEEQVRQEEALANKPKAYIKQRIAAYPSIGDQLDALFHAGVFPEEMAAKLQAVKDENPKE